MRVAATLFFFQSRATTGISANIYIYIKICYNIVTRNVTVDGHWIVNWIYCTLQPIITAEYLNSSTTNSVYSVLYISQSQSYITTDNQSVRASWFRASFGAHDQMLITV
jgi:hypothetical protein